jgi:hypothetical protein
MNLIFLQDEGSNLEAFAKETFDDALSWRVSTSKLFLLREICCCKYVGKIFTQTIGFFLGLKCSKLVLY